jgi:putative ABC transport system substrate-binding protein
VPRIGVLAPGRPPLEHFDAFREGLRDLGYTEGQTIVLEPGWDEGSTARHASLVADLVRLKVDIIVAGTTPAALAAKKATRTIPIVMAASADPVGAGLVTSLARPGGNTTGMSLISAELSGKRIGILKEAMPSMSRVASVESHESEHGRIAPRHQRRRPVTRYSSPGALSTQWS